MIIHGACGGGREVPLFHELCLDRAVDDEVVAVEDHEKPAEKDGRQPAPGNAEHSEAGAAESWGGSHRSVLRAALPHG